MIHINDLIGSIAKNDPSWQGLLEGYRKQTPQNHSKGEGLFQVAEQLTKSPQATSHRLLIIALLNESMVILKDKSSTEVRVHIVAALIRQLALGKQRERSQAAQYIMWLEVIGRSSDRANSQAQRAVSLLQKEFTFLQED